MQHSLAQQVPRAELRVAASAGTDPPPPRSTQTKVREAAIPRARPQSTDKRSDAPAGSRARRASQPSAQKGSSGKAAEARLQALAPFRVAIEAVSPEIDGGRFPAKAVDRKSTRLNSSH